MNKAELIDVLTQKLGSDRRQATAAVENVVDTIVRAVHKGDSVTITGFGVFEQRRRAARVARNPRTGGRTSCETWSCFWRRSQEGRQEGAGQEGGQQVSGQEVGEQGSGQEGGEQGSGQEGRRQEGSGQEVGEQGSGQKGRDQGFDFGG